MRFKEFSTLIFTLIISNFAQAQGLPDFPFVIVKGTARIELPPDLATVSFSLTSYGKLSEEAVANIEKAQVSVLDIFSKFEIPTENVTTQPLQKYTRRKTGEDRASEEITGYELGQNFEVKLTTLEKYSDFVDSLLLVDNLVFTGQYFDLTNRDSVLTDLVNKAGLDARAKAENIAKSLGVRVVGVYAINEGGTGFGSFSAKFGIPGYDDRVSYAAARAQDVSKLFVPKTIPISSNIDVVYRIKP